MNNNTIMTKKDIEKMAFDLLKFLQEKELDSNVSIYFNNKRLSTARGVEENMNPYDYFDYVNPNHILSLSFEGPLYDMINWRDCCFLSKFFQNYGLCGECGNSWNMTVYPCDENMQIETTPIKVQREPELLTTQSVMNYPILAHIMSIWGIYSEMVGESGSCVLGAGFEFEYEGDKFFMPPNTRFQGSLSWETHKDKIEALLKDVGCTNIRYHWGNMD